jgi:HK97 gp10 family phage protein
MAKNLSVDQFQQLLASIPPKVAEELKAAVLDGARSLTSGMRLAVPRGIDGRNELMDSIRIEQGRSPLRKLVRAGGPLTTREVRKGSGTGYDYALANEFGTEKMAAQPFFWPTYRSKKKKIRSDIAARARKAIAKVVPLK